ncbi:MAG: zinc-dependent peptidase [Ignavibacteriae bacterium]|nr:zinc-dependent peptidase [Ignavibacteriota bacterium]
MDLVFIIILIAFVGFLLFRKVYKGRFGWIEPNDPFPVQWRAILTGKVAYYNALSKEEKSLFEYKVQEFLLNCRITGIKTQIDTTDKLLVASSAIIPILKFSEWKYTNIREVLVYPALFNEEFKTEGSGRRIAGMVGNGYMEGMMILSKHALRLGFANESDKKNTAIHEFVHLIDKTDGSIDGIPELLLEKQYTIPWIDLINKKIDEIYKNKSDINPYGGTNKAEFFSVVSEYFFERPKLLAKKHPELYDLLEKIFKQEMKSKSLNLKKIRISRNTPCPCNSGLKFKKCCGNVHYN